MTARRRVWCWALAVWAVLVGVAGGLTLWLRDSAEPAGRPQWQLSSPTSSLPDGWRSACDDAGPDEQGRSACLTVTSRQAARLSPDPGP